jgi:hypothetical protein
VIILNIKQLNVFVYSQLCLQEERYDTKGEEFREAPFVWCRLCEGKYLQTFDKTKVFYSPTDAQVNCLKKQN